MPMSNKSARARASSGHNGNGSLHFIDEALSFAKVFTLRRQAFSSKEFQAISQAVSDFATSMKDYPWVQTQIEYVSDGLERLTEYAETADLETVAHDAMEFARRRPLAMFVGAVAAGAVASSMMWPQHSNLPSSRVGAGARRGRGRKRTAARAGRSRASRTTESRSNA